MSDANGSVGTALDDNGRTMPRERFQRRFNVLFPCQDLGFRFIRQKNIDLAQCLDHAWRRQIHLDVLAIGTDLDAELACGCNKRSAFGVQRKPLQQQDLRPYPLKIGGS